jgi:hypothetical protein
MVGEIDAMATGQTDQPLARRELRAQGPTTPKGRAFCFAGFLAGSLLAAGLAVPLSSQSVPGPTERPVVRTKPGVAPQYLWSDPGNIEAIDFATGPDGKAGLPEPPFQFVEEDLGGSNPKVKIRDAQGRLWIVKWTDEINSEPFATRLALALGYFARPAHYVREGQILGAGKLRRAANYLERDGYFDAASFKLISDELPYLSGYNWAWTDNPFLETPLGARQLNGLKILMMLTSNWDAKDTRDARFGPNTAIYRVTGRGRVAQFLYAFDDWGATMGKWGYFCVREKWDCDGYVQQTPEFVKGVKNGYMQWGFSGKHKGDLTEGIAVEDVSWLLHYLGRISDRQLREGLRASGANEQEVQRFSKAIRQRIQQLEQATRHNSRAENIAVEASYERR